MNVNEPLEFVNEAKGSLWIDMVHQMSPRLPGWASTFHPDQLPCQIEHRIFNGAYNLGLKVTFSDGVAWLVRFPRVGNISLEHADEKVAMEVEVMSLIRKNTTIPVPEIKAWGLTADNPLGLGPFIMMKFIQGISVNNLLRNHDAKRNTRLIKEDINEGDLEFLYRQFANFLIQLFKLDFYRIGSLPTPETGFQVPIRPLTWKVHDIIQTGGVDTFGDRSEGFLTTTGYFQYLLGQDWEQLLRQPNSICGECDAEARYASLKVLKSLVPGYVDQRYDRGPFKLICDDLGLANLIVRSEEDLTVVGVVHFEWSYIGPAQMFGSAPWWLLQQRLNNWDTYFDKDSTEISARFLKYLGIFKQVLGEEEERMPGNKEKELLNLVKQSEASGTMWLHMVLSSGFNHADSLPFMKLREHVGTEKWKQLREKFYGTEEMRIFVAQKLSQLAQYDQELEKAEALKKDMDSGGMTREAFIAAL